MRAATPGRSRPTAVLPGTRWDRPWNGLRLRAWTWPEAVVMDNAAREAALCPAQQVRSADEGVDWAVVETDLSGHGVTLKLL